MSTATTLDRPTGVAERVAFLRNPRAYGDAQPAVQVVETHLSWVFLAGEHVYKMKKPLRFDHLDLREPAARAAHCRLEIRLNRRLAGDVYLGAVALVRDAHGHLRLGGEGEPADWLVHMRRLPEALMLDRLVARGDVRHRDVVAIASTLAHFYVVCAPDPITAVEWRLRLAARIRDNLRELSSLPSGLSATTAAEVGERQLGMLDRSGEMFDRRVHEGLVVEGHGDLRPEHVCLESPPRIIDCLEFSRELRVVDPAEELGFLALECERLGAPGIKADLFAAYAAASGDPAPAALVDFYQSHHACVRAKLALRHLADNAVRDPQRWIGRAREYLSLAQAHIRAAMP